MMFVLTRLLIAIPIVGLVYIIVRFIEHLLPDQSMTEDERRRELASLARKLRLEFNFKSDFDLPKRFSFLTWLKPGLINYAYNIFHGYYRSEYLVTIFDYTFSDGKYDYYWSAFVLEMKTHFPDMIISHENRESRLAEALGKSHISFQSAEFSRAFRVRCQDKKFAFDICHPQMMEFLLANQDLTIEIRGNALAVLFEDWLRPEKVEFNLSRLVEIRKLLPHYLFTKT
jgi:hypothetical protein